MIWVALGCFILGAIVAGLAIGWLFGFRNWRGPDLCIVAGLLAFSVPCHAQQHTFFDDEFNARLDTATWYAFDQMDTWGWQDCLRPENVMVDKGVLTLISDNWKSSLCVNGSTPTYNSGAVSFRDYSFTYGVVEVRAKMSGSGTWPAIWLLGTGCPRTGVTAGTTYCQGWDQPGKDEIDIAEVLWGSATLVNQAIHSGGSNPYCLAPVSDASRNWHTYTLIWRPNFTQWMVDGKVTCTQGMNVPTTPMFLIIDSFMGGAGGAIVDSALPQTMQVDYVRITPAGIEGNP